MTDREWMEKTRLLEIRLLRLANIRIRFVWRLK